jgi:hypothetical protein
LSSRFLFIRIPDASMHLRLPSGLVSDERTDRNGATTFYSLPPGRYELSAIRDTETIFNTAIDLQNDTNIWIKVADPFENMIIAVCIVAAISAAGIIIYRLKPRRTRLEHSSPEVDTLVYDYVALNQGIISKSRASVDLRIPQDALNQAISRLVHSGRLSSG